MHELSWHSAYIKHVAVTDILDMQVALSNLCAFAKLESIVLYVKSGHRIEQVVRIQQDLLPSLKTLDIVSWDAPLQLELKATSKALEEVHISGNHVLILEVRAPVALHKKGTVTLHMKNGERQ